MHSRAPSIMHGDVRAVCPFVLARFVYFRSREAFGRALASLPRAMQPLWNFDSDPRLTLLPDLTAAHSNFRIRISGPRQSDSFPASSIHRQMFGGSACLCGRLVRSLLFPPSP